MALSARAHLLKRVVAVIIACALLSLIWFNADNEGQLQGRLRKTYDSLSNKPAKQSAASTVSALTSEEQPGNNARPHNVMTPPTIGSHEPPNVNAQPHNVNTLPINVSNEQPDVDIQLHNTQPHNVTTPPANISGKPSGIDVQLHNVTTPSISVSSPAPFPPLPPPDDEEYMAICMAGEHL